MASKRTEPRDDASLTNHRLDRAVSPVIGVVLLIALTVMISAIVGTFVLGLAGDMATGQAPTTEVAFAETDSGAISVTHDGGETLDRGTVEIVYTNQTGSTVRETWATPIRSGDSPDAGPFAASSGSTVRVVWAAPGGDSSYVLGEYETA